MAVRVYDTIKQGNDLDFPIVDSNAISGGTYYKNTEEERDNLSEEYIIPGAFCYVIENKITYRLQIVNDNEEDLDGIQLIETVNNNFKKYKNSNGELIYKKVINDKDYYLMWKSFGEKTLPTLTYNGSTKLYVNLNEDIKIDINFQSDNYGDCSIVISKNGNSYKTITNKKGNITLTLDRLSSEGTYNYRIQGYDFYGIEATTYIDITIVCGGLKFSSDFVDYLNNNIIGVNRSIPITYNSFSEDETIKYIYLKFELYNEDDNNHNNILDKCINMTSAAGIFAKCSSINHEFPNTIFKNNTNLTTIEQAFAECNFSKIEKETQLFDNNNLYNNLTNLAGLFYKVPFSEDSIAGSFLFANSNGGAKNATNLSRGSDKVGGVNASVHETYGIFGGSYLRQFDYQIFINLKKLQDISYMFYNNIDKYNRKIEFINTTNNNSLNDSMSLEIFNGKDNNKNETIQNMSYMFYKCNIKGVFSDTPNDLKFGNFVKLQNVSHMFYGATFDNTIDLSNLFKDNIYLNNLSGCFANSNLDYKMSNLKEDSEESPIFDNLNSSGNSTIDLSGLFYNTKICGRLPINLFNGIRNLISDISLMFYDCKYLGGEISSEDCNFNNDNFIPTGNTKDKITLTISKQTEDDYLTIKVDVDVNGFLGGCTELTNAKGLFGGCVRLKGAIPDDLFYLPDTIIYNDEQYANSTTFKITDISYLFDSCINLD